MKNITKEKDMNIVEELHVNHPTVPGHLSSLENQKTWINEFLLNNKSDQFFRVLLYATKLDYS